MKKILFLAFLSFLVSCKDPDDPQGSVDFDRTAFLENYVSNFILPEFQQLETSVSAFNAAKRLTAK